jgi:hypothetical protein
MMTKHWFPKHKTKTFERIIFKNPLKARGLHPMGAPSVHPSAKWKPSHITNPRVRPRIFGLIISKSAQRLGACEVQISSGSTRRQKGLVRGFRPVISQGQPFVGRGRTTGRVGRPEKEADLSPGNPSDSCAIRSAHPTFPRETSLNIRAD